MLLYKCIQLFQNQIIFGIVSMKNFGNFEVSQTFQVPLESPQSPGTRTVRQVHDVGPAKRD